MSTEAGDYADGRLTATRHIDAGGRRGTLVVLGATIAAIVLLDATIVRGVLVPTVMQLAGRANWWTPPLRRRTAPARHPVMTTAGDGGSSADR